MTAPMIALVSVLLAVGLLLIVLSFDGSRRRLHSVMSTSPIRVFLGVFLVGVALAAGLALHQYKPGYRTSFSCGCKQKPPLYLPEKNCVCHDRGHRKEAWQDPVAIVLVFVGLGAGASLVTWGLRQPRS